MGATKLFAAITLACWTNVATACSCFGPSTFCETLDPPYEEAWNPSWWIPDHIVLGVKLATVDYGVDLLIVQDFSGGFKGGEAIRVWGDCGSLCRTYNTGPADGDTVLWGIKPCDLWGNQACGGTNFELPEHYQLPVCGIYWLGYSNGVVSGPLFTEGANESVSISAFADLVSGCLSLGGLEHVAPVAGVRCADGQVFITAPGGWSATKEVCVTDADGRLVHEATFMGDQGNFPLPWRSHGMLLVRVSDGVRSSTQKILFD